MEAEATPDLVNDKAATQFASWFKQLPQVGDFAAQRQASLGHSPTVTVCLQEASIVRFFDRKGFYSVHDDAAIFIARTFYKTEGVLKNLGGLQSQRVLAHPTKQDSSWGRTTF